MMCKVKHLLFGNKYEQNKNEFEDKYILGIFNIQSILLVYVERYKSI